MLDEAESESPEEVAEGIFDMMDTDGSGKDSFINSISLAYVELHMPRRRLQ